MIWVVIYMYLAVIVGEEQPRLINAKHILNNMSRWEKLRQAQNFNT